MWDRKDFFRAGIGEIVLPNLYIHEGIGEERDSFRSVTNECLLCIPKCYALFWLVIARHGGLVLYSTSIYVSVMCMGSNVDVWLVIQYLYQYRI